MTEPRSDAPVLWLTERDVVELVDLGDAIDAIAQTLMAEHRGTASNIAKALGTWGERSSGHALGAVSEDAELLCFKTWVNTPRGAAALLTLFDSSEGRLLATIEAGAVGALRTAAVSGVATRALADEHARTMGVIGSGRQALAQVAAVHSVRDLESVRVYSPTEAHRVAFAQRVTDELGVPATAAGTVREALERQPIVTLVSRAREPFVTSDDLEPGTHVNAVGAILPANAELVPGVLDRASIITVDNLDNARRGSRELVEHFGASAQEWSEVTALHAVVAGAAARPAGGDLSVFKGMGMGLSDLAVAGLAYRRAAERGIGREIAAPVPASPRWLGARARTGMQA